MVAASGDRGETGPDREPEDEDLRMAELEALTADVLGLPDEEEEDEDEEGGASLALPTPTRTLSAVTVAAPPAFAFAGVAATVAVAVAATVAVAVTADLRGRAAAALAEWEGDSRGACRNGFEADLIMRPRGGTFPSCKCKVERERPLCNL